VVAAVVVPRIRRSSRCEVPEQLPPSAGGSRLNDGNTPQDDSTGGGMNLVE
jgi:hypothetical protein